MKLFPVWLFEVTVTGRLLGHLLKVVQSLKLRLTQMVLVILQLGLVISMHQ